MTSRNRKALILGLAAGIVWLRYAKSAQGVRSRLKGAGDKVSNALATIEERGQQLDNMVREIIETGRELTARTEMVISGTLQRLEETATVIQENVTQSAGEISSMVKDIRDAVGNLTHSRSQAA